MVFFDRALHADEAAALCAATRPVRDPVSADDPPAEEPNVPRSLEQLMVSVKAAQLDETSRAEAAVQLAAMGAGAKAAVPALVGVLEGMIVADGVHLPRVEERFRNAVIRALLDIDPRDPKARKVLAKAFAKPFFDSLDTSKPHFAGMRPLLAAGRWMDALEAYRAHLETMPRLPKLRGWGSRERAQQLDELCRVLPLRAEYFDSFLSGGLPFADAHYNAYNGIDTRDGYTYTTIVERVPYEEVLRQFEEELKDRTDQRPDHKHKDVGNGRAWTRMWTRLKIVRISPDGNRKQAVLEGDWFMYDAFDEKNDGWSVILDGEGYIHLVGGQHNSPRQEYYLPGSWERLGIAEGDYRPQVMYWVSKRPNDITEFEFVGQKHNPRSLTGGLNYMNFARSREGHIFLYGRGRIWSWALHRYDEDCRRWMEIKGSATHMLAQGERANPDWSSSLGNTLPYYGPGDGFVAAWQPGAYNYNRAWSGPVRGIAFDLSGRMHVELPIRGVGKDGRMTSGPVYAWSDDLGRTFHAADGTPLRLPLTVNPIPGHDATLKSSAGKPHFDLWVSLVRKYGTISR